MAPEAGQTNNPNSIGGTHLKIPLLILFLITPFIYGADPTAQEILDKCIQYHDPNGEWSSLNTTLLLEESRPDGTIRKVQTTINLPQQIFRYEAHIGDDHIIKSINGETCKASFNGSDSFSKEIEEKHRLSCERIKWFRNYYTYLFGLPMKLKDPGTILDPTPTRTTFMDQEVLSLKVTYDPEVGGEVWLFYVDPQTYSLTGCRFYRKDVTKDGEYIIFEGESNVGAMRLPRNRTWHMNADGKLLGTDSLVGVK